MEQAHDAQAESASGAGKEEFPLKPTSPISSTAECKVGNKNAGLNSGGGGGNNDDQEEEGEEEEVDQQLFTWRFFDPDADKRVYLTSYGLDIADYYTKYEDEDPTHRSLGKLRVAALGARGLVQSKFNKLFKTKMHLTMEVELVESNFQAGSKSGTGSANSPSLARHSSDSSSDGGAGSPSGPGDRRVTREVRTQVRSAKWSEEFKWELSRQQLRRGALLRFTVRDDFGMGPSRIVGQATYPVDTTTMTLKPSQHQVQLKKSKDGAGAPAGSPMGMSTETGHLQETTGIIDFVMSVDASLIQQDRFKACQTCIYPFEDSEEIPLNLEFFVFPNGVKLKVVHQGDQAPKPSIHMFVLTNQNGLYLYAHCIISHQLARREFRGHLPPWKDVEIYEPISICTLSKAPFHVLFQTIMRDMVTQLDWFQRPEKGFVRETMLSTVYNFVKSSVFSAAPLVSRRISRYSFHGKHNSGGVFGGSLPYINVDYKPLFSSLESHIVILVVNALLCQMSLVVKSASLAKLTFVLEALHSLLFPLQWNGVYIPILPNDERYTAILDAPVPFMVGLPFDTRSSATSVDLSNNDGLVIVDLDRNDIHPFILPIPALPPKTFSGILNDLIQCGIEDLSTLPDFTDEVTNAIRLSFAGAVAGLLDGAFDAVNHVSVDAETEGVTAMLSEHDEHLACEPGSPPPPDHAAPITRMEFSPLKFLKAKAAAVDEHGHAPDVAFFDEFINTQIFESFIEYTLRSAHRRDFVRSLCKSIQESSITKEKLREQRLARSASHQRTAASFHSPARRRASVAVATEKLASHFDHNRRRSGGEQGLRSATSEPAMLLQAAAKYSARGTVGASPLASSLRHRRLAALREAQGNDVLSNTHGAQPFQGSHSRSPHRATVSGAHRSLAALARRGSFSTLSRGRVQSTAVQHTDSFGKDLPKNGDMLSAIEAKSPCAASLSRVRSLKASAAFDRVDASTHVGNLSKPPDRSRVRSSSGGF